jgi:phage major head subunit gpT-like protein
MKLAGLNAAFMTRYEQYESPWRGCAMLVPSGKSVEDYAWLGDIAKMEELKDRPVPHGLKELKFAVANKEYQAAIKIARRMLNDDQYGQALQRINQLAEVAKVFPGELVRELRVAGTSGLSYDGQAYYGTTHTDGDSNLVSQTGTSDAQIVADATSALTLLWSMKTDKGKAYPRTNPNFVAKCAAAMAIPLRRNLMLPTVSTGGTNVFAGIINDVQVDQGLSGNNWYIDDEGAALKPFIVQENEGVSTENTQPGTDSYVHDREILYVANWYGAGAYGMYKNSVKIG